MKLTIVIVAIVVGSVAGCFMIGRAENHTVSVESVEPAKTPSVLVELFTSEGCSSCPPADRVLTILENDQLIPNAEVITLAFHVDYWDYLGWKDRFSTAAFSRRQEDYSRRFKLNSSYTPQMVVDGSLEFVGSSRAKANETIAKSALESRKAGVELRLAAGKLFTNI